ncbi:hypothetical protein U3A58_14045 [Algoriphagus sp. C2-6-M1]|uniref:hypothetical protein n=1 Tax=Algoriphagus persicinus TaxID=3108754 RepID=UPI002B37CCF0|nr:hypothetical protein [Algoriphagus sp. C2-6-M1]MEB2781518.1 hypothetical protein [Algoriphagus sp. C2-6-M1]
MTSLMMSHSIFSPTAIITTEEEWRWATSIMMAYWIFKYAIPVMAASVFGRIFSMDFSWQVMSEFLQSWKTESFW